MKILTWSGGVAPPPPPPPPPAATGGGLEQAASTRAPATTSAPRRSRDRLGAHPVFTAMVFLHIIGGLRPGRPGPGSGVDRLPGRGSLGRGRRSGPAAGAQEVVRARQPD